MQYQKERITKPQEIFVMFDNFYLVIYGHVTFI